MFQWIQLHDAVGTYAPAKRKWFQIQVHCARRQSPPGQKKSFKQPMHLFSSITIYHHPFSSFTIHFHMFYPLEHSFVHFHPSPSICIHHHTIHFHTFTSIFIHIHPSPSIFIPQNIVVHTFQQRTSIIQKIFTYEDFDFCDRFLGLSFFLLPR